MVSDQENGGRDESGKKRRTHASEIILMGATEISDATDWAATEAIEATDWAARAAVKATL